MGWDDWFTAFLNAIKLLITIPFAILFLLIGFMLAMGGAT